MSDNTKRVKNPHPEESPVQVKKRVKATASPTLSTLIESRIKNGSPGSAAALPSDPEAAKPAKKTAAKKTAAKTAEK